MAELKLTKNELRDQQKRLSQLNRYLPTLQLKKSMLQAEVNDARIEVERLREVYLGIRKAVEENSALFSEKTAIDFKSAVVVKDVFKNFENIAGVEIPVFAGVTFEKIVYSLFETPPWVDGVVKKMKEMLEAKVKITIAEEKKIALEKELREVSIRVNLFEKILIPRAIFNIKKIKVFLGDQQLSAVSQAKVAKNKIVAKKDKKKEELTHAN